MKAGSETSPDAECLTCGYLLRGLPAPVCPECARAFDPDDSSTFDADPRKRRRRRLWNRIAVVGVGLAVAGVLFPRGLLKADVTFTCSRCKRSTIMTRWQLNPPSWIPFAYPGINSRNDSGAGPATPLRKVCDHQYDLMVRTERARGGRMSAAGSLHPDQPIFVNGVRASMDTAPQILRTLMNPDSTGIHFGLSGGQ